MELVAKVLNWVGWAGIIAGIASLVGAFSDTLAFSYAGIDLPDTFVGAGAILGGGLILMLIGRALAKKSGCSCCAGKSDE